MNSILLTENEIREYEGIYGFNRVNYGTIAKAAAIHAVQYLEGKCPHTDSRGVAPRRIVDCPDCMANIKMELVI